MGKRITTEDFKKTIFELTGDEFELLSEYKNAKTKVIMKHNKCGNKFEIKPDNFKCGNRCPFCAGKRHNIKEAIEKQGCGLCHGDGARDRTHARMRPCADPYADRRVRDSSRRRDAAPGHASCRSHARSSVNFNLFDGIAPFSTQEFSISTNAS